MIDLHKKGVTLYIQYAGFGKFFCLVRSAGIGTSKVILIKISINIDNINKVRFPPNFAK